MPITPNYGRQRGQFYGHLHIEAEYICDGMFVRAYIILGASLNKKPES